MLTPATVPITAWRNVPYAANFLFVDDTGAPIDFTTFSAGGLQVRLYGNAPGEALITLTDDVGITLNDDGTIDLTISETALSDLPAPAEAGGSLCLPYDLVLTSGGLAEIWMQGTLTVLPGVTR